MRPDVHVRPEGAVNTDYTGWENWPLQADPMDHLGLVGSVVKRYRGYGILSQEDYWQEGFIGLLKACRTYNPSRGAKFSTHAVWMIYARVSRAHYLETVEKGWSRKSGSFSKRVRVAVTISMGSTRSRGFSPDEESPFDVPDHRENYEPSDSAADLSKGILQKLQTPTGKPYSDRDVEVLKGLVFEERTMDDVAEEFGVSRQRIDQIEKKMLASARTRFSTIEGRRRLGVAL